MFIFVLVAKRSDKYVVESHFLELVWTLLPMVILVFIALPSLYLLYLTEDSPCPTIRIKAVGHQWYWEYESRILRDTEAYDSYILQDYSSSVPWALLRNLDVDNRVAVPAFLTTYMLVTSADVLHSWTVPILGVKVDAIPGRLNYLSLNPSHFGVFYGQCSELCGSNHRFMPIVIEALKPMHIF